MKNNVNYSQLSGILKESMLANSGFLTCFLIGLAPSQSEVLFENFLLNKIISWKHGQHFPKVHKTYTPGVYNKSWNADLCSTNVIMGSIKYQVILKHAIQRLIWIKLHLQSICEYSMIQASTYSQILHISKYLIRIYKDIHNLFHDLTLIM